MSEVNKFFRANGLYTFVRWNNFFVNPPLTITKEELREGLEIIDKALEITDDSVID
jgi:taurine--2-oxoglutarate transaminase